MASITTLDDLRRVYPDWVIIVDDEDYFVAWHKTPEWYMQCEALTAAELARLLQEAGYEPANQ